MCGDKLRPMICGVDPGTTVGLAFLSINGRVLDVSSGRHLSINDVIFEIEQHGDLVILACDRSPIPKTIQKIGASFKCRIFCPERLSVAEKKLLVKGYKTKNNHEKDALAAALKAYRTYSPKLKNLKKRYKNFEKEIRGILLREELDI